ncbi:aspartate/glutamate racemase family protein [Coleofasciculus chthonoplastes]|uniref:aspartate/glutamate racemase family protein n=1 Tax=Coleofasciculus chthonoplastes TaxID=64178 RepID=UPI0032F90A2F
MLGILGGMGPLASAEFIKTIYEYNLFGEKEQIAPKVLLYSDPSFPDRTEVLLRGEYGWLLKNLTDALYQLCDLQVSRIIICCITSHYLLPQLPIQLKERIISLVDVILNEVIERQENHLLLCTNGTRKLKIFQDNNLWQRAKKYIVLLDDEDQKNIHNMIYQIKIYPKAYSSQSNLQFLESMNEKYKIDYFIAGCTEIHLLNKFLLSQNQINYPFLDPLIVVAQKHINTVP